MADSKKADIWMPLYVADYLADTAYLTTEQSGAYLHLLMAYWRNGPPPDNDVILASITKLPPDAWSNARSVLEAFFEVSGGFWIHKRVEAELDKAKRNRAFAHERAVKGAKALWAKKHAQSMLEAKPEAMLEHMLEQCTSPSPSPTQSQALKAPLNPPEGERAVGQKADPAKPSKRKPRTDTTLQDWLTSLDGEDAIQQDDTILQELTKAGVPEDFQVLYWQHFKRLHIESGKRQKDWRAAFRNAVRGNWYKLWWFTADGECKLTTAGEQARRAIGHD